MTLLSLNRYWDLYNIKSASQLQNSNISVLSFIPCIVPLITYIHQKLHTISKILMHEILPINFSDKSSSSEEEVNTKCHKLVHSIDIKFKKYYAMYEISKLG